MTGNSLEELFQGYIKGFLSKEELHRFLQLLQQPENADTLKQHIDLLFEESPLPSHTNNVKAVVFFNNIMTAAKAAESVKDKAIALKAGTKINMFARLAIAASVIGLIIMGGWLLSNKNARPQTAKAKEKKIEYKNDVLPGGDKAVLTLADGSTIVLDDAKNGSLSQQGNSKVIKIDGKLAYDVLSDGSKAIVYNTIATPKGGQYQVELADGTQVWLNAASSLHFPTAFTGKERRVEITGEAYFEVKKNAMPFVVSVNGAEVQVLGTHFNVMAYNEEEAVKTTLLEGAVNFISGAKSNMLKPGQQAQLEKSGHVKVESDVDVESVLAWKNGLFHFESSDLETVLRQIARWYDVEVVFKSKKTYDPLYVEMPRNTKLSDVLKALEISGGAKFDIQGKKIIVIQ